MKIFVKAKPNAKVPRCLALDATHFTIAVKESPIDGKANEAIRKVLAEHFGVPRSRIQLISGQTSKSKVFEIIER